MNDIDDFDLLYNKFIDNKRKKGKTTKQMVGKNPLETLPIWKEVKSLQYYDSCLVCRLNIDDEDIVESCGNCGRYYHYKHIREWFKIKATCPACRH